MKIKLNLKKMAAIVACLVMTTTFSSCEEEIIIIEEPYMVLGNYGLMVMREDLGKSTWSGARDMCKQTRVGGFSDWRLPTKEELAILYNARNIIGGFETSNNTQYWSSTPHDFKGSFYMCLNFTNGYFGDYPDASNHQPLAVRCVRNVYP